MMHFLLGHSSPLIPVNSLAHLCWVLVNGIFILIGSLSGMNLFMSPQEMSHNNL